jgi:hypothetical protein
MNITSNLLKQNIWWWFLCLLMPGVRTWQGELQDLPNYLGWAADLVVLGTDTVAELGLRASLLKPCLQVRCDAMACAHNAWMHGCPLWGYRS